MTVKQQLVSLGLLTTVLGHGAAMALPPPEDQPEEVLRNEIILEARSPLNGEPMTAAEYAELEAELDQQTREVGTVPARIRRLITLLRLRKALRTILPFLP